MFAMSVGVPAGVTSLASSWASSEGAYREAPSVSAEGAAIFLTLDADRDTRLSRSEHAAGAGTMFSSLDENGDGFVTSAELDAVRARNAIPADGGTTSVERIAELDRDGDARLSAREHEVAARAIFRRLDVDADGFLSVSEIRQMLEAARSPDRDGRPLTAWIG
jgi:Ca2+-binding EF-hand superfamily protein